MLLQGNALKVCRKCRVTKPLDEFHIRPSAKDGRYMTCKECRSKMERKRYAKNKGSRDGEWRVVQCENCAFIRECKDQMWVRSFTPYCFVSSKYHEFYQKEYKREVTA